MKKIIEAHNFSKNYGKTQAVKEMSFEVQPAQIVGLVGKNGAGKSTLLRALTNMIFPSEGSLKIMGMDAVADAREIKNHISYLPSETQFGNGLTTADLITFATSFRGDRERAFAIAKDFELDINKKIGSLSLGNRKKAGIVMLLLAERQLYILDEPTNGLDPLMQLKFFEYMKKEKEKGHTIFLSSHNLADVEKYCDRVIIIKDGQIVDDFEMKERAKQLGGKLVSYSVNGEYKSYRYSGSINELVKSLNTLDLEDLEIKEISMQDQIFSVYEGEI